MVDEVQTGGGGTGRMWHLESWDLPRPPHIVTFAKKMQTGGFYFTGELMPEEVGLYDYVTVNNFAIFLG